MRKFLQQAGWGSIEPDFPCDQGAYAPPGVCFGGSEGSSQQQSQQSSQQQQSTASLTLPVNMQNPSAIAEAPYTMGTLQQLIESLGSGGATSGIPQSLGMMIGQATGGTDTNGMLAAPVTDAQNNTLTNLAAAQHGAFSFNPGLAEAFSTLQSELNPVSFGQKLANGMPINATVQNELNPGFASGLATGPETQAAIQAALQPTRAFFNAQTAPGVVGSFAQAGQRQGGSSAFDMAFGNSLAQEQATEAATAGNIANQAYQTGLGITANAGNIIQGQQGNLYSQGANISANAPGQISALSSNEVNSLIQTLQAQALPQLTQQLGINNGLQVFQQSIASIMQALGLQTQAEQPVVGYESESAGQGTGSSQGTSSGSSQSFGFNLLPGVKV